MPPRLGQHFLKDRSVLSAIADALALTSDNAVLEIGPGHGEFTRILLEKFPKMHLVAIEKDVRLAETLHKTFPRSQFPNFKIIEGDVRLCLIDVVADIKKGDFKVVGNIPYYLTGYLFRLLGELPQKPRRSVFLIQKEVAERAIATPPRMNILASTLQIWVSPTIILNVPAHLFSPPPKVESAVICLVTRSSIPDLKFLTRYFAFVRILFRQPRKTALNNLVDGGVAKKAVILTVFHALSILPTSRPQDFSITSIITLAKALRCL